MIKYLMSLITTFASFVGLLGNINPALANPTVNKAIEPVTSHSTINTKTVDLNVSGSLWQLNDGCQDAKDIFDHLACSCAACSQTVENLQ